MGEEKFDAIIVGAGLAGSVTAFLLAKAGLEVLMVERGNFAGAKNMTGGRLYSHSLEQVLPGFAASAPVERRVARERISLMTETGSFNIDYTSNKILQQGSDSYVILRSLFDRWLFEKAEEAGAMGITGILVDDLILDESGKVKGIVAVGEEMMSDVVVLAEGANSILMEKSGLAKKGVSPKHIAVGAKEIIEIGERAVEDRFNVNPGEGVSWLLAGYPSDGRIGGGLIYTNRDSVSIGVVVTLSEFEDNQKSVHEMLEQFKGHPSIKPLLRDGKLVEYSGHMVAEGGFSAMPELYGNGVLAIGDAAGLVMNLGYTIRGLDLAVGSAIAAADAIIEAKEKGSYSKESLARYSQILESSFVMKEMCYYSQFPKFMENRRIFNDYPAMLEDVLASMFLVDGGVPRSLFSKIMKPARRLGLFNIIKDGIGAMRAL